MHAVASRVPRLQCKQPAGMLLGVFVDVKPRLGEEEVRAIGRKNGVTSVCRSGISLVLLLSIFPKMAEPLLQ